MRETRSSQTVLKQFHKIQHTHLCSLGFGDNQDVIEQEEVSVLSLHPRLQLSMSVEKKRPVGAGEEGLDQWAGLWTHRNQEALSEIPTQGPHQGAKAPTYSISF